ncbi:MAG: hypothetical protein ABI134_36365 [Byssovorax sp.]
MNNREEDLSSIAKQAEDKGEKGKQPELLAHFMQRSPPELAGASDLGETGRAEGFARARTERGQRAFLLLLLFAGLFSANPA